MKSIFKILTVATLCGALVLPMSGQGRGRNQNNTNKGQNTHAPASRPGQNHGGQNNNNKPASRPGQNHGGQNNNNKPAPHPGQNNGGHHQAPRPDYRPNHNHGSYRPGTPPPPSRRPHLPAAMHFYRPTPPPPAFRPYRAWPSFSTILGFRIGSAIASVVSSLAYSNYNVISSTSDAVYLNNVPMMNYMWPDAVLTFNSVGRLAGSEFISGNIYNDRSMYNSLYSSLCATYGSPYAINNSGPYNSEISWWGPDGQYIRLSYSSGAAYDGTNRFYTTLNFGVY